MEEESQYRPFSMVGTSPKGGVDSSEVLPSATASVLQGRKPLALGSRYWAHSGNAGQKPGVLVQATTCTAVQGLSA